MESYYAVVEKLSENKDKEKPLETEEIALLVENNDKSNDNDSTMKNEGDSRY